LTTTILIDQVSAPIVLVAFFLIGNANTFGNNASDAIIGASQLDNARMTTMAGARTLAKSTQQAARESDRPGEESSRL
jgi:hypothetical protein